MNSINIIDNLNEILKTKKNAVINIVNDKLTLSVFEALQNNLKNVKEINFILKTEKYLEKDGNIREFDMEAINVNDVIFNAYDIIEKNSLKHFNSAKNMYGFIESKVNIKKAIVPINSNIIIVDDSYMIIGSSSLEVINKRKITNQTFNFDISISENMDKEQIVNAQMMFKNLWYGNKNSIEFKEEILSILRGVFKENSPEFMYYFVLNELFGDRIDNSLEKFENDNTHFKSTEIWKALYNFQKDAVLSAIQKLENYGGCIIADSVGLGKTYEALGVIKYYELKNDNVLVLCPAKLSENWNEFRVVYKDSIFKERFNYKLLFHTDLSRYRGESRYGIDLSRFDWSIYDLVIIDESHNFRNRINKETETRYDRLIKDVITKGTNTKVLLLSATPVNNSLGDLRNQISLITKDDDSAFYNMGIPSIANTLKNTSKIISTYEKQKNKEGSLYDVLPYNFYKLLESLTISRSRKHILEYYKNDGLGEFPTRLKPISKRPHIDRKEELLVFDKTYDLLENLELAIYTPMKYILPEHKEYYNKLYRTERDGKVIFKQESREVNIKNLQMFNLLKRLESSVHSFGMTISRINSKIESFIVSLENGDKSIDEQFNEEIEDELLNYKLEIKIKHINKDVFLIDLKHDKKILEVLTIEIEKVLNENRDAKLEMLEKDIIEKIKATPYNDGNKKILIFTAFADTAKYIYHSLEEKLLEKGVYTGLVTGSERRTNNYNLAQNFSNILRAFSPKAMKMECDKKKQITILIATDCISEGQNLQDCDMVINYDIHWNPVRLIQRFGRIDRIGSINKNIQMVNYFPSLELNEYLKLEKRIKTKLLGVNLVSTGDENILNPELNDISFRAKQLEKLKDEILDLEEDKKGLSLTDLNMNEYLSELLRYVNKHKELKSTPTGIYTVTKDERENVKEGVIFCFKHKNDSKAPKNDSSLYPYYIIYIDNDGEIIYNNTQSRTMLKALRYICLNKDKVDILATSHFLKETNGTKNMKDISALLSKSIESIQGEEEKNATQGVFDFGGFNNHFENEKEYDFELISFFVIYK